MDPRRPFRLEDVARSTAVGLAAIDAEGVQTYVNPAFCQMVGWTAEELVGAKAPFVYWPPEERDSIARAFGQAMGEGLPPGGYELRLMRKTGERFGAQLQVSPLADAEGRRSGWLASLSELEHEATMRRLLGEISAVLASSLDYQTTLATVARLVVPAFADWCAIDLVDAKGDLERVVTYHGDPERVRLAEEIRRLYPPRPLDEVGITQVIASGQTGFTDDIPDWALEAVSHGPEHLGLLRQMGMRSCIVSALLVRGHAIGAISLLTAESGRRYQPRDIRLAEELARRAAVAIDNARLYSALKQSEQQAQSARASAEEASRAKDAFLAMLGHELRNPLAPIVTALHLMKLRGDGSAREQAVIERQVHHLVRLVDDLLDVSRITRGRVELRRSNQEVGPILAKALELVAPLIEQRRHRMVSRVAPDLWVEADEVRLAQVVANLLTNAAKYTEPGGLIELTAGREGSEVVVRVTDSGMGIAADLLPHIFELFTQGQRSAARSEGGLGIGLTLVRSLVELHGGTVTARSAGAGRGSELEVRLPVAPAAPALARANPSGVPVARPHRVLLVDDNLDALLLFGEALRAAGHEVVTAGDGPECLRALEQFRPDVAVLDIGLPGMDGYELASELRRRLGELRLIAMTGYGQERDRERSRQTGFERHLVKPVDPDALLAAIDGEKGGT